MPSEDFILKPVRHSELLDWLASRLSLTWLEAAAPDAESGNTPAPVIAARPVALIYPAPAQLEALREVVALGYYRGILNQLDEIDASDARYAPFVLAMRDLARQFQFEFMGQQLSQAPYKHAPEFVNAGAALQSPALGLPRGARNDAS